MNKRLLLPVLSLLTGLLLTTLLVSVTRSWPTSFETAFAASEADFSLTILHTNDIHAHFAPYNPDGSACTNEANCLGGTARLKTLVDQQRILHPNSILVDAGDQFQGTLYYKLFKAEIVTQTMNAVGYQAMAVGNHEFDDGPAMLRKLIDGANFPILGTNLDVSAEPTLAGKLVTVTVLTVGGEQVGLIGLTTPDTAFSSKPGPNVVFNDPVASAQAGVAALQALGVNKIIALTHLGYDVDIDLAKSVDGLDVIVGGHSHTFVYSPTLPITFTPPIYPRYGSLTPAGPYPTLTASPNGDPVLVTTAFCWLVFLGKFDVTFDDAGKVTAYGGDPIYLANTLVKDAGVTAMMLPYDVQVEALRHTIVGTTTVDLPVLSGADQICRLRECRLGDLVTDAILWQLNENSSTTAGRGPLDSGEPYDIALLNGGSLRAPLTDTISVGDVLEVLPFGNTIATFEITGTHIISALESGLSNWGGTSSTGRFPQVAGMRYAFDPIDPAGHRLISVEVKTASGYSPLNLQQVYRVATNDFMRTGGDGYTVFRDYAIHPYDFGPPLDEVVQDYIQHLEIIHTEDITTGRIALLYRAYFPWVPNSVSP